MLGLHAVRDHVRRRARSRQREKEKSFEGVDQSGKLGIGDDAANVRGPVRIEHVSHVGDASPKVHDQAIEDRAEGSRCFVARVRHSHEEKIEPVVNDCDVLLLERARDEAHEERFEGEVGWQEKLRPARDLSCRSTDVL